MHFCKIYLQRYEKRNLSKTFFCLERCCALNLTDKSENETQLLLQSQEMLLFRPITPTQEIFLELYGILRKKNWSFIKTVTVAAASVIYYARYLLDLYCDNSRHDLSFDD